MVDWASWALDALGECGGRADGVPKRGGEAPRELDKAAARAEMPGPGDVAAADAPGRGVILLLLLVVLLASVSVLR